MTRTQAFDLFSRYEPFTVGFERALQRLDQVSTDVLGQQAKIPSYPPYNILKHDEDHYTIEMAVAGFDEEDIDIEVEDSILTIKASSKDDDSKQTYIYRGIAKRAFTRSFTLAETVEVQVASYDRDGILRIELVNIIPEHKKPRKIEVSRARTQRLHNTKGEPQLLTE